MDLPKYAYQIPRGDMVGSSGPNAKIYSKTGTIIVNDTSRTAIIFFSASPDTVDKLKKTLGKNIHSKRETAMHIKTSLKLNAEFRPGTDPDLAADLALSNIYKMFNSAKVVRDSKATEASLRRPDQQKPAESNKDTVPNKSLVRTISAKSVKTVRNAAQSFQETAQDQFAIATSNVRLPQNAFEMLFKNPISKEKILLVDDQNVVYSGKSGSTEPKKPIIFAKAGRDNLSDPKVTPTNTPSLSPVSSDRPLSQSLNDKEVSQNSPQPTLTMTFAHEAARYQLNRGQILGAQGNLSPITESPKTLSATSPPGAIIKQPTARPTTAREAAQYKSPTLPTSNNALPIPKSPTIATVNNSGSTGPRTHALPPPPPPLASATPPKRPPPLSPLSPTADGTTPKIDRNG